MKRLERTEDGKLVLTTSPVVTKDNFPSVGTPKAMPKKTEFTSLLTEEQLLEAMLEAGGKDLTTSQFALLITPCIKKSEDPLGHHRWDVASGHIRALMGKLEKQGKVTSRKDPKSKKTRYLYTLK